MSLDDVMAMDASEIEGWMRWFIYNPAWHDLLLVLLAQFLHKDDWQKAIPGVVEQMYFDWPDTPTSEPDPQEERRRHLEATMGHSIL